MPTCDTSWLLAFLDPDDVHHLKARAEVESGTPVTIPGPVLAELLQVVFHKRRRTDAPTIAHAAARRVLQGLESLPTFRVAPAYDEGRASDIYHANEGLSYVDAVGVAMARSDPGGLLSFDGRQQDALTYSSSVAGAT